MKGRQSVKETWDTGRPTILHLNYMILKAVEGIKFVHSWFRVSSLIKNTIKH